MLDNKNTFYMMTVAVVAIIAIFVLVTFSRDNSFPEQGIQTTQVGQTINAVPIVVQDRPVVPITVTLDRQVYHRGDPIVVNYKINDPMYIRYQRCVQLAVSTKSGGGVTGNLDATATPLGSSGTIYLNDVTNLWGNENFRFNIIVSIYPACESGDTKGISELFHILP